MPQYIFFRKSMIVLYRSSALVWWEFIVHWHCNKLHIVDWAKSFCKAKLFLNRVQLHTQEVPRASWNPKVHYCVHYSRTLVPVLNQINSVYILSCLFRYVLILLLTSAPRSELSPFFRPPYQNYIYDYLFSHSCHMLCRFNNITHYRVNDRMLWLRITVSCW